MSTSHTFYQKSSTFAEYIFERFSADTSSLQFADFSKFIQSYPLISSRFLKIFNEICWKDLTSSLKISEKLSLARMKSSEMHEPDFFSGRISIIRDITPLECYGVIRNNLFVLYNSEKMAEVIEVVYLTGCSIKLENNQCKIFQNSLEVPRMVIESKTDIKTEEWYENLQKPCDFRRFRDFYELGNRIGSGKFSDVYIAEEFIEKKQWAVKIIKTKHSDSSEKELVYNEISILKALDHKNIVKCKETFNNNTHTLIVIEYLEGGSLDKYIGKLSESQIKNVVTQILQGLKYIHEMGIVHGDIKPENVLFEKKDLVNVKIVDFGLSSYVVPGAKHQGMRGTLGYIAPEMHLHSGFRQSADIWSVGIITYRLLTGKQPFNGTTPEEIVENTLRGEPDFAEFNRFSSNSIDFIKKLLDKSAETRISAEKALNHIWLLS